MFYRVIYTEMLLEITWDADLELNLYNNYHRNKKVTINGNEKNQYIYTRESSVRSYGSTRWPLTPYKHKKRT